MIRILRMNILGIPYRRCIRTARAQLLDAAEVQAGEVGADRGFQRTRKVLRQLVKKPERVMNV